MHQDSRPAVAGPNPALQPFSVLIGNWTTTGTHGRVPATLLHGHTSFAWLENGAFLLMRSEIDDPRFPTGLAIFASDDAEGAYYMLTVDERGVSRKYDMTLADNVWKWWRTAPGFFQRYEGRIVDGGTMIVGKGELSKDGVAWEQDLDLTYTRVA